MGARVEQKQEERAEAAPCAATPTAAPPAASLRGRSLSASGVVALQRLVGNAAVVEIMASREEPKPPPPATAAAPANGSTPPAAAAEDPLAAPSGPEAPANGSAPPAAAAEDPLAAPSAPAAPAATPPSPSALLVPAAAPAPAASSPAALATPAPSPAVAADATPPGTTSAPTTPASAPGVAPAAPPPAAPAPAPDGAPAPAAAPTGPVAPGAGGEVRDPQSDPGFSAMKGATKAAGSGAKEHQSAPEGAATAQGAAEPPANDVPSQAAAAQVDEMSKQEPAPFDKAAFVEAIKKAVAASAPKNLDEADKFAESGKADEVKDEVQGKAKEGKEDSEKDIKTAKDAEPDKSKAKPKTVTPMVNDKPGAPPKQVGAAKAMPGKRPPSQTDLSGGPKQVDAKMAEADVTDEQLKKSNEPEFADAVKTKDEAKEQSAKAPVDYRGQEQKLLDKGRSDAESAEQQELTGMHGARTKSLDKVAGKKDETKSADETKRDKVGADIQGIYDATKADVTKILDDLDGKVDGAFSKGEGEARSQFESYYGKRMSDYKDERYSGMFGWTRWIADIGGMPDEVNQFHVEARERYITAMDGVISDIADIVGRELTAARARITKGRSDVQQYVAKLPSDLKEVGKEAEGKLETEFEQLSSDVDSKQEALVEKIAQKYVEARDALDERIKELQEENKGFIDKALDAITGVIETIKKLANMLLGVLARAAGVIGDIIKDPIGFLGNLISGIKGGLDRFVGNIGSHLEQGLMGWLFGALGKAGLEMPKALDLPGIIDLVTQVLGLTYDNVRVRLAKAVGEPLVAKMEQTVDVIKTFATQGVAGAWEYLKDSVGDLNEMVVGEIKEFVTERVIKAGITWIAALLTPAGAFIKACKAIFDIVMFIVERGAEIMAFVNSVLDSISAIVKGNVGEMASRVEDALAQALPLAISFLASLLGLGGVGDKVRGIIEKVQGPINKAIDKVVTGAVKTFKKMFKGPIAKAKKAKQWVTDKVDKGKQWAKDKVEGAKGWARDTFTGKRGRGASSSNATGTGPGEGHAKRGSPNEVRDRFDRGRAAALAAVNRFAGRRVAGAVLTGRLRLIKARYGFGRLDVVPGDDRWGLEAELNPKSKDETEARIPKRGARPISREKQASMQRLKRVLEMVGKASERTEKADKKVAEAQAELDAAQTLRAAAVRGEILIAKRLVRSARDTLTKASAERDALAQAEAAGDKELRGVATIARQIAALQSKADGIYARLVAIDTDKPGGILEQEKVRKEWDAERVSLGGAVRDLSKTIKHLATTTTPGPRQRRMAEKTAIAAGFHGGGHPTDLETGLPMTAWHADHITSRARIADDARFELLNVPQRKAMFQDIPENLFPLSPAQNESKGSKSMVEYLATKPWAAGHRAKMRELQEIADAAIEAKFAEFLNA